jgi:hypothetical protein
MRPGDVRGDHLSQDKRPRHRITPLRLSPQKHWLTIIIVKRRVPRHLLPKLRVAEAGDLPLAPQALCGNPMSG